MFPDSGAGSAGAGGSTGKAPVLRIRHVDDVAGAGGNTGKSAGSAHAPWPITPQPKPM